MKRYIDDKSKQFIQYPKQLNEEPLLSLLDNNSDVLVYMNILNQYRNSLASTSKGNPNYQDQDGVYCVIEIPVLAKKCRVSVSTVIRTIKRLEKFNLISANHQRGTATKYYCNDIDEVIPTLPKPEIKTKVRKTLPKPEIDDESNVTVTLVENEPEEVVSQGHYFSETSVTVTYEVVSEGHNSNNTPNNSYNNIYQPEGNENQNETELPNETLSANAEEILNIEEPMEQGTGSSLRKEDLPFEFDDIETNYTPDIPAVDNQSGDSIITNYYRSIGWDDVKIDKAKNDLVNGYNWTLDDIVSHYAGIDITILNVPFIAAIEFITVWKKLESKQSAVPVKAVTPRYNKILTMDDGLPF